MVRLRVTDSHVLYCSISDCAWVAFLCVLSCACVIEYVYCGSVANKLRTSCRQVAHKLTTSCPQVAQKLPTSCQQGANKLPTKCPEPADQLPTTCQQVAEKLLLWLCIVLVCAVYCELWHMYAMDNTLRAIVLICEWQTQQLDYYAQESFVALQVVQGHGVTHVCHRYVSEHLFQ